jgi:hypothetical protein
MAQPTPYTRTWNFAQYQQNNPAAPYVGSQHDTEFNNVATSIDEILTNLELIQRDDGALSNGVVTPDSLNQATINMIGEWNPRGTWATATNYAVLDMVTPAGGTLTYVCAVAHTSGATFAGDLALGYWQPVNGAGIGVLIASNFTFTATDRILGRATVGAGGGEEIACTAAGRALLDDASAADQRVTLGLGTTSDPTFDNLTVTSITVPTWAQSSMVYVDAAGLLASTAQPTNGQLLIGSTGSIPALATITGTPNRVTVNNGAGSITLTGPQDIGTTSSPTFASVSLTNIAAGVVPYVGPSSELLTSQLYYDAVNNRLGIGPASPQYGLDITKAPGQASLRLRYQTGPAAGVVFSAGGFGMTGGFSAADEVNTSPFFGSDDIKFSLPPTVALVWASSPFTDLGTFDVLLRRDAAATLALARGATAQSFRIYRDDTDSSNYERMALQNGAGYFEIAAETAGTGTANIDLRLTPVGTGLVGLTNSLNFRSSGARITGDFSNATRANRVFFMDATTNSSTSLGVIPNGTSNISIFNLHSSSDPDNSHFIQFQVNATSAGVNSSAVGTGTLRALDLMMNSQARFTINTAGVCNVASPTATPAGGSTTASLLFGTTAAFGIYYGSGAPTVAAAKGSLYLRSDGSGVNDRMYVATDGAGTWTAVVTVA